VPTSFWAAVCGASSAAAAFFASSLLATHLSLSISSPSSSAGGEGGSDGDAESGWAAAKRRMEGFINQHGFVAIWALATFPSGAFDLCGVCCGQLRVPFKVFFSLWLILGHH
jgi:hypothetical protein